MSWISALSFRLRISHSTKEFPVSWVIMVSGNQPSFGLFFNFKSIKGALLGRDRFSKKKKSLYRDLTGVVQEAEKQFIRVSLREELQLDSPDSERNQRFSKLYDILIWSRRLIRVPIN